MKRNPIYIQKGSAGKNKGTRCVREWDEWLEDAKEYYALHGDLLVPLSYITDEGELLGLWIFGQRYHRNSGKIYSEERIKQLDLIGMVWNLKTVRDDDWERMYAHIKAYKTEHGKLPLLAERAADPGRKNDGRMDRHTALKTEQ